MSTRPVYVICSDDCRFEGMTREQILTAIQQAVADGYVSDPDSAVISKIKEINKSGTAQVWVGTEAEFNAISPAPDCALGFIRTGADGTLYFCTDDTSYEVFLATVTEEAARAASEAVAAGSMFQKLLDVTTTEVAKQIDLDLSIYDLSEYSRLEMHIEGLRRNLTSSSSSSYYQFYMRVNGDTAKNYGVGYGGDMFSSQQFSMDTIMIKMTVPYNIDDANCSHFVTMHLTPGFGDTPANLYAVAQGFYRPAAYTDLTVGKTFMAAGGYYTASLSDIKTINVLFTNTGETFAFCAGARFIIYGVRK